MHKHFAALLDFAARKKNLVASEPMMGRAMDLRLYAALFAALTKEPLEYIEFVECKECGEDFRRPHVMSMHYDDRICPSCRVTTARNPKGQRKSEGETKE